jgi:hypothetical protein
MLLSDDLGHPLPGPGFGAFYEHAELNRLIGRPDPMVGC